MDSDLLDRLRWGNLARAAALLAIIAAIVLWPRLGPPEPALPADSPQPVATAPEPDTDDFTFEPERVDPPRRRQTPGRRRPRRRAPRRATPAPAPTEPPAAPIRPPRWFPPPPQTEFGPE